MPREGTERRRGPRNTAATTGTSISTSVFLSTLLLIGPVGSRSVLAANCGGGVSSPRASASYSVRGHVEACGGPASAFRVEVTAHLRTEFLRLRDGETADVVNSTVRLFNLTTNAAGDYSRSFNWCTSLAGEIPAVRAGTIRVATQEVSVRIVPTRGTAWTSPRTSLASTNTITQNRTFSMRDVGCDPTEPGAAPIVNVLSPDDGAVFEVEVCPFETCAARFPVELFIDGTSRIDHVDVVIRDALSGVISFTGPVCLTDPIEGESCGTVFPDFDTELTHHNVLRPGDHLLTYTATDDFGQTGSQELRVRVIDRRPAPPGALSIERVEPFEGAAPIDLRVGSNPIRSEGTTVELVGENLHEFLDIYLSPRSFSTFRGDWVEYEVEVESIARDGRSLTFRVPEIPAETQTDRRSATTFPSVSVPWRVILRDRWIRPDRVFETILPDPASGPDEDEHFDLREPPYPLIHGFGFDNEDEDATLDEFLAVYRGNAFLCGGVGLGGGCIGVRVPDPLYFAIWFPVYKLWIDESGGSCVGMSGTSLLMAQGRVDPRDFDPDVLHPAGFDESISRTPDWDYDNLLGPLSGFPEPENLWAAIRRNHGVQTSAQYIRHVVRDLPSLEFPFVNGNPNARVEELRSEPLGQVVCMVPGLGQGHCVTPYRVTDEGGGVFAAHVYDNNEPLDATTRIEFDTNRGEYDLTHASDYEGRGIFTVPGSVFREGRTMPGLDAIDELVLLVFGDADELVTTESGERSGRLPSGERVHEISGATQITPLGAADVVARHTALVLPRELGEVETRIASSGGDYVFHAAQGGHLLQLVGKDLPAGDEDHVAVDHERGRLASMRVFPARGRARLVPRVGLSISATQSAVFSFDIEMPADDESVFRADRDSMSAAYENTSGRAVGYSVVLEAADGDAETRSIRRFGPLTAPAGATQRLRISDWPAATTLLCETDLDSDGIADTVDIVRGSACGDFETATPDADGDGLADACESTSPRETFRRGDGNADGRVDISDAQFTLNFLFRGGAELGCVDAGDANDDGRFDLSDAVFTLGFLFGGGAEPPAPGPASCGVDPTNDALGCVTPGC